MRATMHGGSKGEWRLDQLCVGSREGLSHLPAGAGERTPNRPFIAFVKGKFDRGLAMSLALLGHVALLAFFWDGAGARAGSMASEGGEGSMIIVDFVAISPRVSTPSLAALAQPVDVASKANADAAAAASTAPTESLPVAEGDQRASNTEGVVSADEKGRRSATAAQPSSRNEASSNATPTSGPKGEEGTAANDGLEGRYLAAIKRSVAAHWPASAGRKPGVSCTLTLYQTPGGQVQSAISKTCALDEADRRRLEAAALMAQPLPYEGFEAVFRKEVVLEFDSN